ncbi:MAG TPA: hypothetical protein VKU01_26600 [Bryobacteraceae bacterium]|nr:hypothetical protein [Bryobacteraceae bacterium]
MRKALDMPQEWHQRQQSGALVGKVNDGVGKVVQTSEALGRELFPASIRTVLSMIPPSTSVLNRFPSLWWRWRSSPGVR